MTTEEMKVDALCRMILGTSEEERNAARNNLCRLLDAPACGQNVEVMIHELLNEIGVPTGLVGHGYIVDAVLIVVDDPKFTNNMSRSGGVYETIAKKNEVSKCMAERGIRHAVEVAWTRGDPDVLAKYFGNTVDYDKAKPTNTEFISRLANIIRLKLKA